MFRDFGFPMASIHEWNLSNEARRNALENLRGVLSDYASEQFGRDLARGPINGFIDSNELYNMFLDFFEMFVPQPGDEWSSTLPDDVEKVLSGFKGVLDYVMLNKADSLADAALVDSPAWRELRFGAAAALWALRDL